MGIDISTTVGVGFEVEESELESYFPDADLENHALIEILETFVLEDYPLLTVAQGGNSMNGEDRYVISVDRLEQSWDQWDMAGGVYGLEKPVINLDEHIQLMDVAAKLIGREPKIGQFVAVHIY